MISTTMDKLKRYCSEPIENIENYQEAVNDKEHVWQCHHRLEVQGQFRNSKELLERCGMYWNRPARELIFLRMDEHKRLHMPYRTVSETTSWKLSTPVRMTRISDGFTKVFPSQNEAARWLRENGYPKATQGCLGNCIRGITKYSYGAHWSYT